MGIWIQPFVFILPAGVVMYPSLALLAKNTYAGANTPCIVLTQVGRFAEADRFAEAGRFAEV